MSRFSKAEAEARGWVFTQEKEPETVSTSETQGEYRVLEGDYRAENFKGEGNMISLSAPTIGQLLEQISGYEAHQDKVTFGPDRQLVIEPEVTNLNPDTEEPIRDVTLPDGSRVSSEELNPRRAGEVEGGKLLVADPDIVEAQEAGADLAREAEYIRTEDPLVDAEKQNVVITDESGNVSDVRQVRAEDGGGTIREILERRDPEVSESEQARVADSDAGHYAEGEFPAVVGDPVPEEEVAAAEAAAAEAVEDAGSTEAPSATPAAEAKAEELGVDLAQVEEPSGVSGDILVSDVEAAAEEAEAVEITEADLAPALEVLEQPPAEEAAPEAPADAEGEGATD